MLYEEINALSSEIHTKHMNALWAEHRISEMLKLVFIILTVQSLFIIHLCTNKIALKIYSIKYNTLKKLCCLKVLIVLRHVSVNLMCG